MNCFDELRYSIYADGELSPAEAREVEAHLADCPACRTLVEALRVENRLLAETLAGEEGREFGRLRVERVVLMQSRLSPRGSEYSELAEVPLR